MRFNKNYRCKIRQWERASDRGGRSLKCFRCYKENLFMSDMFFKEKDDDIEIYCGECFLNFLSNELYVETSDCDEHDDPIEEEA